jgi:5-methylcytosine-specific restriction protein A
MTQSGRLSAAKRGYNSRWQKYRITFLMKNPLCVMHLALGQTVAAEVVDHIDPHKGDHKLFWNPKNHQALCKHCHDAHKQRLEKSGVLAGCNTNGIPLDPKHHWQTGRGVK